jgi:hypothetical protein
MERELRAVLIGLLVVCLISVAGSSDRDTLKPHDEVFE